MFKIFTVIIAAMIALNGYTQESSVKEYSPPLLIKINKYGIRKLVDAKICWFYFDQKWSAIKLNRKSFVQDKGFPVKTPTSFETKGQWNLKTNGKLQVHELIRSIKAGVCDYSIEMKSATPIKTKSLRWHWLIPVNRSSKNIIINGRNFTLPEKFTKQHIFSKNNINNLSIKFDNYTVSFKGEFSLFIQDDRKFGRKTFCLRFGPNIIQKKLSELKLTLRITIKPPKHSPINLNLAMNMGFSDKHAGDSQGGWTDQGPFNDLSVLKAKSIDSGGIKFKITDPESNQGKSCIILANKKWRKYPATRPVKVNAPEYAKYIYLLHASAWTPAVNLPIGTIKIDYADGSSQNIIIRSGEDCNNWWNPIAGKNCAVSWTRVNNQSCVGLYSSQFKLNNTNPVKITFANQNKSVWMIVAACFGEQKLELNKIINPMYIVPGKKWIKLNFARDTVAGSPLDFSNRLDAPAGKYGKIIINRKGHFAFAKAPAKRIKFFGVNICFDVNFMKKKESEKLVEELARHGYNSVRMHHFDRELAPEKAKSSLSFDENKVDRMNYLFAKLKERGFYICIDLYASRRVKPGDNIPECSQAEKYELKLLIPFSKKAMDNWKQYARKLLSRKNPYTGLSWAEDPALYALNLINEAPLMLEWNRYPKLLPMVETAYIKYLKRKGIYSKKLAEVRSSEFLRFLNETQAACIKKQIRFLREELELKALITDLNYCNSYSFQGLRNKLDFVDNHIYQDSPKFRGKRWRYPFLHTQSSAISLLANTPRKIMPTRIFNKPFTVTEFNYSTPNIYRGEAGPVMGGYAALQDWDGIYRFAWSHFARRLKKNVPLNSFDCALDPIMQLSDYMINFLYLRGDVQAAKQAAAFVFNDKLIYDVKRAEWSTGAFPEPFNVLGLYCRIGSLPEGVKVPEVKLGVPFKKDYLTTLPAELQKISEDIMKTRKATSVNKQIELNAKANTIKIVTPRSEAFCVNKGNMSGRVLSVQNVDTFTTIMASSLDGKKLVDSCKIIIFHLTDVTNSMIKFSSKHGKIIEDWGKNPLLLRVGKADISLAFSNKSNSKVQMLALNGKIKGEVEFKQTSSGKISFRANTSRLPGGVMIYYITRN